MSTENEMNLTVKITITNEDKTDIVGALCETRSPTAIKR